MKPFAEALDEAAKEFFGKERYEFSGEHTGFKENFRQGANFGRQFTLDEVKGLVEALWAINKVLNSNDALDSHVGDIVSNALTAYQKAQGYNK